MTSEQKQKKDEAAKAVKKVAKKVAKSSATTVGKPKGVGYGDVTSTNLLVNENKASVTPVKQ